MLKHDDDALLLKSINVYFPYRKSAVLAQEFGNYDCIMRELMLPMLKMLHSMHSYTLPTCF